MKTKGVAVSTIIMIMLGIVVLLFVGYWLVRAFSGPGLSAADCQNLFIDWCRICASSGFTATNPFGNALQTCGPTYASRWGTTWANIANIAGACSNGNVATECGKVGIGV